MKQLVESLTTNGFHEVTSKGAKVAQKEASTDWQHVAAKEGGATTFQKGKKKVVFKNVPSGLTTQRHIEFVDGDRQLSFTNSGDLPTEEFLKSFYEESEAPEEKKK